MVDDVQPGTQSSNPALLGVLGGRLMFAATWTGSVKATGRELYATVRTTSDFDGEGRADLVVYRPGAGQWWINRSASNFATSTMVQWGVQAAGDVPAPADFDGDGKADPTVFRPQSGGSAFWFIRRSIANYADFFGAVGATGDAGCLALRRRPSSPIPRYRPSTRQWFILRSSTGYADSLMFHWGAAGDIPVPADYDGDRRTDVAIHRPSTGQWFIRGS